MPQRGRTNPPSFGLWLPVPVRTGSGFLSWGYAGHLAMSDPTEVGTTFVAGHVASRYPRHYSVAFAFSVFLYPLPHRFALRLSCPRGGAVTGLPSST